MMQTRIAPDRSYGEKLIALFAKLLFSGNRYSLTELADSLGCSKQTVLRLIDDITLAYDVPLRDEIQGGRKYVWIERTGEAEPAALLTETEHRTLQMCRSFTEHLLGRKTFQEAEYAVEKSGRHLPPGVEPGQTPFGVVRSGVIDYTAHEDVLRTLIDSMDQHLVCEVSYQNLTADEPKTFHIKPLKVFAHRESVYVHARRAKSPGKPYKVPKYDPLLAVHRFKSARLTDVPFRRPAHYDFEKVMNQGFGVWNQKKFRVVVELNGWAANFARERIWSPDQEITELKSGGIRLEFWTTSEPEVVALVLSFGSKGRIIGPDNIREIVEQELMAMTSTYEASRN
ncbi:MAG: WYL domain-containing protein [Candidatus Krumholzibacteria bacterium]|nr:WYL domain-containing protein [Candidatus Krumholzibacteria bacterium]